MTNITANFWISSIKNKEKMIKSAQRRFCPFSSQSKRLQECHPRCKNLRPRFQICFIFKVELPAIISCNLFLKNRSREKDTVVNPLKNANFAEV